MALITIQRGELTERLRRFFGIVGSYAGQVDTVSSPVVVAQNLDLPPFRQDGVRFFTARSLAPAAGQVGIFRIATTGKAVAVVDQICIYNNAATAGGFRLQFQAGVSGGSQNDGKVPELSTIPLPYIGAVNSFGSVAAVPPAANILYQLAVNATSTLILPTEITINPGFVLEINSELAANAVRFSVSGRVWEARP